MNPQFLFQQGVSLHQKGDLAEAEKSYRQLLVAEPGFSRAWQLLATLLYQQSRLSEALQAAEEASRLEPGAAEICNLRGVLLQASGRREEALASFRNAVARKPDYAEAHYNCGIVLGDLHRPGEALASFENALATGARAETWNSHGVTLQRLQRFEEALRSYDKALAMRPDYTEALYNRGIVLGDLNRPDEALASFDKALAANPHHAETWNNRGAALQSLARFEDALASYDKALAVDPDYPAALGNRSIVLRQLKRFDESLAGYDRLLAIKPDNTGALYHRGVTLWEMKRFGEALASIERALAIDPDHAEAWNARGSTLRELKRPEEALASYDKATAIKPDFADAWSNRGNTLQLLDRFEEALACYDRAVTLKPDLAEALLRRGTMQWSVFQRYEPAIRDLESALLIDPFIECARGDLLHMKMHAGDWRNYNRDVALLEAGIRAGKCVSRPLAYQAVSESPADLQACSAIYAGHFHPPAPPLRISRNRAHAKIRLGYVCGDFREQAITYLMAELYERHDKNRFEIVAFDSGRPDQSPIRRRLEAAFDKFVDISALSDREAADRIAHEETDILITLNDYYRLSRMGVFALRPAPIQVNYLGYPGTLGAPYMDYVLADRFVIPEDERKFYTEHVVYLPDSYQVNDSRRVIAPIAPTRAECDLPESAFIFCSFNQSYKLTPEMFALWMNVLRQVEGSVLWMWESNPICPTNFRREAAARGIDPQRLVFAPSLPQAEHLARMKLGDLFLDTLPCNAHTTASDALWAGLPILTCRGRAFSGRVASSLLHAIGLPELVTENLQDYEALALKLARDSELLQSIRQKLAQNRLTTPLFDTDRYRRHIESAYTSMWEIWSRGETPRSFGVDSVAESSD